LAFYYIVKVSFPIKLAVFLASGGVYMNFMKFNVDFMSFNGNLSAASRGVSCLKDLTHFYRSKLR
jgi:hypothetical protein